MLIKRYVYIAHTSIFCDDKNIPHSSVGNEGGLTYSSGKVPQWGSGDLSPSQPGTWKNGPGLMIDLDSISCAASSNLIFTPILNEWATRLVCPHMSISFLFFSASLSLCPEGVFPL